MPKPCMGGRKSSIINIGCYVCPNCHRFFSTTSVKLMVRYKKLHSKKCNVVIDSQAPSLEKVMKQQRQNRKQYKGKAGQKKWL